MKKELQYLVIHSTATQEGKEMSATTLRRMHTSPVSAGGRGWKQVGYSAMVHLDGTTTRLVENNEDAWVDDWEITNGATGYNAVSRHIVYVGGIDKQGNPKDTRTDKQKKALEAFVKNFHAKHPRVRIVGHRELCKTACPSFDVQKWLKEIGINQ